MLIKKNVILALALLLSIGVYAQKKQVRGVVLTAESKQPLEGATISVNRTSIVTTTNKEGRFQLDIPEGKNVLTITFVGREPLETEVKTDNDLTILLKASNSTLEEVVAVAYTTVKRSGYPGAVATIGGDKINNRLTPNLTNALQGLAPGIQTSSANGQPGNSSSIRIRGVGSINASSAPLFVIDGAPYD